ncbi:NAC domain-containing protein 78-like [Salvia hispanica]|uniref:NAC domain-containing protein 78-like n=1 Tax=Salvia hispanica TaxID=49212 RepID=UPI0020092489|nr:NAC domain-containing protein 78-like [Salvia hispanica]
MLVKGFEFNPSGEDLINGYLYPWVKQEELPWNDIPVKEIYGPSSDPWVVFYDVESRWHSRLEEKGAIKYTIYAFTLLTRVSNSKRVSRGAGTGTWQGQTGPEMIQDSKNGQIIGQSKMLAFKHPGSEANFGRWTMHEFSLSDDLIRSSGVPNAADLVVCKITKTVKKNNKKSGAQLPLAGISKLPECRTTEMFLPV